MEVNKNLEENKLTLAVKGRVDSVSAPELEAVLDESLEGVEELVFDFSDLEYISSAGLRVLLTSYKKMAEQGTMKITNINDVIREIFEVTGFADIFTIE
ncbi:MAG: STAS domain-containing protein [Erysipelotrichaceae bacterium]|nr:STAS domain-containing protein [Erysipelotrichaceae bacterium]